MHLHGMASYPMVRLLDGTEQPGGRPLLQTKGKKLPRWRCPCGFENNANRLCCFQKSYKKLAPISVRNKAQEEHAKVKRERKANGEADGGPKSKPDPEVVRLRKRMAELEKALEQKKEEQEESGKPQGCGDVDVASKVQMFESIIHNKKALGESFKEEQDKLDLLKKVPPTGKLLRKKEAAQRHHTKCQERKEAALLELQEADAALVKSAEDLAQAEKCLQDKLQDESKATPAAMLAGVLNGLQADPEFLDLPGIKGSVGEVQKLVACLDGVVKAHQTFTAKKAAEANAEAVKGAEEKQRLDKERRAAEDARNAKALQEEQQRIIQLQQAAASVPQGGTQVVHPTAVPAGAAEPNLDADCIMELLQAAGAELSDEGKSKFGEAYAKKRKTREQSSS